MNAVEGLYKHIVIIGGGVGGLTAGAMLSRLADSITVLEKGAPGTPKQSRKSIAQANHLHSLLVGGKEVLMRVFPGIDQDLKQAGSVPIRAGLDQKIFEFGEWLPARDLNSEILAQSRPLLESVVRSRAHNIANMECRYQSKVDRLVEDNGRVVGVNWRDVNGDEKVTMADLVIDASGLTGTLVKHMAKQLPALEQAKETVSSSIVYVTARVKKPATWLDDKTNLVLVAEPHLTCGGALLDIEEDHWIVSLNGRNGVRPPTTAAEWIEYSKQLPASAIWDRISQADLVDEDLFVFNKPISYLRRFDKVDGLPAGYFPLGDVINSVNPTFGQGMTLAFFHAEELVGVLADPSIADKQSAYLKRAIKRTLPVWRQTVAYESMFSATNEKAKDKFKALQALVLKKHKQAYTDPLVHQQLFRQSQLLN